MTYGEKLIQLRKNANLTQAELGEQLGVTAQAVSKWEHDVSEPDLGTMRKLAMIFGISVDDFLDSEQTVAAVVPVNPVEVAAEMAPVVADTVAAGVRDDIANSVREGMNEAVTTVGEVVAKATDAVIGHCVKCGVIVKESNKGCVKPKVLCVNCYKKQQAEKAAAEREKQSKEQSLRGNLRTKRNRCLFWGIFAGLLIIAAAIGVAVKVNLDVGIKVGIIVGGVWAAYAVLGVICEVFLSDSAVADVMEWALTRSISWPGVIFTLDFEGLVFLIAIKILFAILGFIAGVALFFLGLSISMVIATFTFPFTMHKVEGKLSGRLPIKAEDVM